MPIHRLKKLLRRDPSWVWPEQEPLDIKSMDKPANDRNVHVASRSGRTDGFMVNLAKMTCGCPGWNNLRAIYGPRDVRRVCPHIHQVMVDTGEIDRLTPANRLLLEHGRLFYRFVRFRDAINQTTITFGFNDHDKDLIKQTRVGCFGSIGKDSAVGMWDLREGEWLNEPPKKHEPLIKEKLIELFQVK